MFGGQDGLRRIMSQESSKPKKTGETLRRFGAYFKPYTPVLLLVAGLIILSTWSQVITPDLTGQAVDCYLAPLAASSWGSMTGNPGAVGVSSNCWLDSGTKPHGITQKLVRAALSGEPGTMATLTTAQRLAGLGRLMIILLILFVAMSVLTGLAFFFMTWAGARVLRALREGVFNHLHRLSMSYYAEHEAGDLMSRITNDAEAIQQAVNFALVNVISGIMLLGWIAYSMLRMSLPFGLLSLSILPFMAITTMWFSSQARKAFRRTRREMGSINTELQESISAVREVQAFNRSDENIENFRQTNAANRDANIRAVTYTSALAPALEALGYIALVIVAGAGGAALLRGGGLLGASVSLGLVVTYIAYVQRFNQPVQQISILWTNLQNAIAGGERIFSLLDTEPEIQDIPNASELPILQGEVEFKHVSAAYKAGESVLCDVSFKAETGQTIAIVGPTGAGKTTIINLIPRFYDPTAGAVLVDGFDVRYVQNSSLRKQIGIVLQDTFLFSTTVMENIRFGRPEASDAEVIAAARLAHVDTFIDRLPDGYETVLGERGSGLSQGQRQMLAIARAALANPRILILDEATSSVDTRTERLIQSALEGLLKGRTSFVIAHRLSTIRNADQVLVLDQGEIVERGRHEELLLRKGFYYDLYMSQFQRKEMAHSRYGEGRDLGLAATG
jgi:ATP-binding cassette, subfamily B, multidrug efflux pump